MGPPQRSPNSPNGQDRVQYPAFLRDIAALVAALEDAGDPGDAAADHEPGDGGADQHLLLVALDLAAPVAGDGQLAAQPAQRMGQVVAVGLDRGADLVRRARAGGHQWRASGWATVDSGSLELTVSLMSFASSIASWGVGGDPAFTDR